MDGKKILIIDDDESLSELLTCLLTSELYSVAIAKSGEQGKQLLTAGDYRPDIILLDMRMPIMNGKEFMEDDSIVSLGIPTILMTASLRNPSFDGLHYLSKPFSIEEILNMINKILCQKLNKITY